MPWLLHSQVLVKAWLFNEGPRCPSVSASNLNFGNGEEAGNSFEDIGRQAQRHDSTEGDTRGKDSGAEKLRQTVSFKNLTSKSHMYTSSIGET